MEAANNGDSKGQANHMFLVIVLLCYNQETWQNDSTSIKDKISVKKTYTLRDYIQISFVMLSKFK